MNLPIYAPTHVPLFSVNQHYWYQENDSIKQIPRQICHLYHVITNYCHSHYHYTSHRSHQTHSIPINHIMFIFFLRQKSLCDLHIFQLFYQRYYIKRKPWYYAQTEHIIQQKQKFVCIKVVHSQNIFFYISIPISHIKTQLKDKKHHPSYCHCLNRDFFKLSWIFHCVSNCEKSRYGFISIKNNSDVYSCIRNIPVMMCYILMLLVCENYFQIIHS